LEEVIKKLSSLEKSLPNLLDNASQVNESIESIGKRITILEASTIHDNQNLRIGKLEESMKTVSSFFSLLLSLRRRKLLLEKSKNLCMFPRYLYLDRRMCSKVIKNLVQLRVVYMLNPLQGI
jgi:hypothetical protein